jgi:hypothetical protein
MNLHALADTLTRASSRATDWSARLHTGGILMSALAIGLVGAGLLSEAGGGWLALTGSVTMAIGLWLSRRAQRVNWRARFTRRRALLNDSLGYTDSVGETLDMVADSISGSETWPTTDAAKVAYYASAASPGTGRLRDNLVESAIWTEKLYRAARRRLMIKTVLTLVVAIAMAAAIVFVMNRALDIGAAVGLLSVALVFVVSADQFDTAERFGWAAAETRRIRESIVTIAEKGSAEVNRIRTWVAFADYAVVTSIAAAVPHRLYLRYSAKLQAVSSAIAGSQLDESASNSSGD